METQKQGLTVFIDPKTQQPQAILYRNPTTGDWTVYNLIRSDEDGIIELFKQCQPPTLP